MTFMFLTILALTLPEMSDDPLGMAILIVPICCLMGTLWSLFIRDWKKPLRPPLRFNRQRREVCVTEEDGNFWFVPWERVHAIAPSVTNLGTYGASKHGSLIIWLPLKGQEHEAYTPNTQGWVMMVNPGGGISSMAQWECIRSFMEIGPKAVPEPSVIRNSGMSLWQSFAHDFRQAKKKEACCWPCCGKDLGLSCSTASCLSTLHARSWLISLTSPPQKPSSGPNRSSPSNGPNAPLNWHRP